MSQDGDRHIQLAMMRGWELLAALLAQLSGLFGQADGHLSAPLRAAILCLLRPAEALARRLLLLQASMQQHLMKPARKRPVPARLRQLPRRRGPSHSPRLSLVEPIHIAVFPPTRPVPTICRRATPNPHNLPAAQQLTALKLRFDGLKHAFETPQYYVRNILNWMTSSRRKMRYVPIRTSYLPARGITRLGVNERECIRDIHVFARQTTWPPWPMPA